MDSTFGSFPSTTGSTENQVPPHKGPIWLEIDLTIGIIQCIATFACLVYAIYLYRDIKDKLTKSFIILTLVCLMLFVWTAIVFTINGYYYNAIWWAHTPMTWNTWPLGWLCWSLGQCVSYILFILRLQAVFQTSAYQLSIYTKIYLTVMLSIYVILWTVVSAIPMYQLNGNQEKDDIAEEELRDFQLYSSFALSAMDVVITVSMIYMFVSRLNKLLVESTTNRMGESSDGRSNDGFDSPKPRLTFQQKALINVAIKVTILSLVSLVSSMLTVMGRGMMYLLNGDLGWDDTMAYVAVVNGHVIWLQIDTIISGICVVLFLPRTEDGYRLLCWCCHKLMSKRYSKSLKQSSIRLHRKRTHESIQTYTPRSKSNELSL